MLNSDEKKDRIDTAQDYLEGAKKDIVSKNLIGAVHSAQVSIEQSAKAVIACFGVPEWEHNVSKQLLNTINKHQTEIEDKCGKEVIDKLMKLAENNKSTHEWHEWSVYGKWDEITKKWIIPRYLCTEEIANWIVPIAEESFNIAKQFTDLWFSGSAL
ncbi:MAG: HEPN domain-containing protein [Elusimicrobiota bacterium]|nr:HEPN domain-containing protein [Elusimicrobiota bacterium]